MTTQIFCPSDVHYLCKSCSSLFVLLPGLQHLLRGFRHTQMARQNKLEVDDIENEEANSWQETLTNAVMHLVAIFLQVILDAALEEVQLGFQLLREAEHTVLTPGQVGVVAQEAQPWGRGEGGQGNNETVWNTTSIVRCKTENKYLGLLRHKPVLSLCLGITCIMTHINVT